MINKYRIIGDIHGRTNWHNLIEPFEENTTYIFVGDYTDPYYGYENGVTYDGMISEIERILEFKKKHSENVILLFGNHDMQYIIGKSDTNRFDYLHSDEISKIFKENLHLFHGVAFNIGEKYLISHAGVTFDWYTKYFGEYNDESMSLENICNNINTLWDNNKEAFTFVKNCTSFSDNFGTSLTHSPVWIRPDSLWLNNIFGFESEKIQVVGHTTFYTINQQKLDESERIATYGTIKTKMTDEEIEQGPNYWIMDSDNNKCSIAENNTEHVEIIFIDCLRKESACVEIDGDTLEWKKITK